MLVQARPEEQERIVAALRRNAPRAVIRWTDPLSSPEPNSRGRSSGSRRSTRTWPPRTTSRPLRLLRRAGAPLGRINHQLVPAVAAVVAAIVAAMTAAWVAFSVSSTALPAMPWSATSLARALAALRSSLSTSLAIWS